jgi:phosphatidylinositol-binding clathrin assembly protein
VAEIFRTLTLRIRDSTWTIVFKALIVLHLMIRDGALNATLEYTAEHPRRLSVSHVSEGTSLQLVFPERSSLADRGERMAVQTQGHNIKRYEEYFVARAHAFKETKVDYVRSGAGRLKRMTVDKGLLRETECVQRQILCLLQCNVRICVPALLPS